MNRKTEMQNSKSPKLDDMSNAHSIQRAWIAGSLVVFGVAFWIFHSIFFTPIATDLQVHVRYVIGFDRGQLGLLANFLYYIVIYGLSGFRAEAVPLYWAGTLTLAVATAARFALDFRVLRGTTHQEEGESEISPALLLGLALALTFSFSLPTLAALDGFWYLGQTPPNVWHNSTTIFVLPFAIALFWVSYRNLEEPSTRGDILIAVLSLLNIMSKPSFFLVMAPVYGLMLLVRHRLGRAFWIRVWPIAIAGIGLAVQYYFLFSMQIGNDSKTESHLTLAPFDAWSHFSPNIILSIVASSFFPLVYLAFQWREVPKRPMVQYALLLYIVSLAIMALVGETGPRRFHGNFFWQSYLSAHVLFLAVTHDVIRLMRDSPIRAREKIILGALGLHVIAGAAYLIRLLTAGSAY
jgi:hypothetical protein